MKKILVLLVSMMILPLIANAAEAGAEQINSEQEYVPASTMGLDGKVSGFVPFVGAGLGYMDRSSRYETEGVASDIRMLGSYYFSGTPYIADLGLGIRQQSYSQSIGGKETTSGTLEAALRYEVQEKISIGGLFQVMAGKGSHVGANSDNAQFIGIQAMKELPVKLDFPAVLRLGGRVMTDVNVSKEQVSFAMLDVAIGFPEVQTVARNEKNKYRPVAKIEPTKIILQGELLKDARNSQFKIDSSEIALSQREYLNKFAMAYSNKTHIASRLHIVGHADDTGTSQHNMQLSKKRAEQVFQNLKNAGVPASMMSIDWKGESMPIVFGGTETQRSLNRRVEIQFIDVKDQEALSNILESIKL